MSRKAVPRKQVPPAQKDNRVWKICAALIFAVFLIYAQTANNGFVNYDDDTYVVSNSHVNTGLTGGNLGWALTSSALYYWHPLTWISHMIDVDLFGVNAGPHHVVSFLIHAENACLLFLVLRMLTGALWPSAAAAMLFAVHPLRVESVAWVAERKDVLSGFFWLLTIGAYARYVQQRTTGRYVALCGAYLLACMSKPSVVSLPLILLLLDFWPIRRSEPLPALIREKLPLFGMALVCSVLTFFGQKEAGAMDMLAPLPLTTRLENAIVSIGSYLGKTFWPHPLAILYPYNPQLPLMMVAGCGFLIAAITAIAYWKRNAAPYVLTGWGWFLIAVIPMIGIVQVGVQSRADRFTYVPQIGLFIAIVWLGAALLPTRVALAVLSAAMLAFIALSFIQTGYWHDSATVFAHDVEVTDANWLGQFKYGMALGQQGRTSDAIAHLREAERLEPSSPHPPYNLGRLLHDQGNDTEAAAEFKKAIANKPDYPEAWYSLGVLQMNLGQRQQASETLQKAISLPLEAHFASDAHNRMGVMLAQSGDVRAAAEQFREAVRLEPSSRDARQNLQRATAGTAR